MSDQEYNCSSQQNESSNLVKKKRTRRKPRSKKPYSNEGSDDKLLSTKIRANNDDSEKTIEVDAKQSDVVKGELVVDSKNSDVEALLVEVEKNCVIRDGEAVTEAGTKKTRRGGRSKKKKPDSSSRTEDKAPTEVVVKPSKKTSTSAKMQEGQMPKPDTRSKEKQKSTTREKPQSNFDILNKMPFKNATAGSYANSKNSFPSYYRAEVIKSGLKTGDLISGSLRINPRNYKEGYVSYPDGIAADILIFDIRNRNRALDGDEVVVELNPQDEWKVLDDLIYETMEADEEFKALINELVGNDGADETSDTDVLVEEVVHYVNGVEVSREESLGNFPEVEKSKRKPTNSKKEKCLNPERETFPLSAVLKLKNWQQFAQKTGRVVAIKSFNNSRKAAGKLELFPDKNPNFAFFRPLDNRMPRMKIPRAGCPPDFWIRPEDHKNYLYVAEIEKWELVNFAIGKLIHNLGDDRSVEVRTAAILIENKVDTSEFGEEIIRCLPETPYVIPEEEIRKRKDFRSECVFTIDPLTARDLDDAMSVESCGNGRYRVGVHIADVSYFVKEGSALDEMASNRATSVYLVQTVVPMLPRLLCEDLCSLNPAVDRLTFSVEWILTESGEIESEWFGRSVIRSCMKLAYEDAQKMIDEPGREWRDEELPSVEQPWTHGDISARVNMLQTIAVNLRKKRIDSGALRIDQPKVCFRLDKESGLPTAYTLYEHRHSNKLIEEFMLLANMSVARKLFETFPDLALLRNHPPPDMRMLEKFAKMLMAHGIPIDFGTSKALQDSFNNFRDSLMHEKKVPHKEDIHEERRPKETNKDEGVDLSQAGRRLEDISHAVKHSLGVEKSEEANSSISKIDAKATTSVSIPRKLLAIQGPQKEELVNFKFLVLMNLCAKSMKLANYFCVDNRTETACRHYALSVNLYTHFTSPIRRYPDIVVHRLLDAALSNKKPEWSVDYVSKICHNSNQRKILAKKSSEKSEDLFLSLFIRECGPCDVFGVVLQVLDASVDCLLPEMGAIKRVYFDKLDWLESYKFMTLHGKRLVLLQWKTQEKGCLKNHQMKLQIFSKIPLTLKHKDSFEFEAVLNRPLD